MLGWIRRWRTPPTIYKVVVNGRPHFQIQWGRQTYLSRYGDEWFNKQPNKKAASERLVKKFYKLLVTYGFKDV